MKSFTRCRMLRRILIILCVLIGIGLGIGSFGAFENISLVDSNTNRSLLLFVIAGCFWLILILAVILLSCIIKDAEEDFETVKKLKTNK